MADIQNFSKAEKLIRENPRLAKIQALEWEKFLKNNAKSHPEVLLIKTKEDFDKWALDHHIDPSVWEGKEISDYYSHLKQQTGQPPQTEGETIPPEEVDKGPQKTSGENALANPQKEEKRGGGKPSVSLSDINRVIREISDAEKTLTPELPISPTPQGEQLAQRGLQGAERTGARAVAQAGKTAAQAGKLAAQLGSRVGAFLLTNPVGWVILAIIVVVIITFVIVLALGAPPTPTENNSNLIQTASPAATLTPAL